MKEECGSEKCSCSCHSKQGTCKEECGSEKCSCSCHHSENRHEMMSDYFLEIADCAWEEVLKDKIKEYILKTQNDRMSELAQIIAEGNHQKWRDRMQKKHNCLDFREKLCNFFSQSKK